MLDRQVTIIILKQYEEWKRYEFGNAHNALMAVERFLSDPDVLRIEVQPEPPEEDDDE